MRFPRLAVLWAALAAGLPNAGGAQSLTSGALSGTVRSVDGAPLFDALVTVTAVQGGMRRTVTSQRDGRFAVALLPAGEYEVLVEGLGFRPKRLVGLTLVAGGTVTLPVTVAPAAGGDRGPDIEDFVARLSGAVPALQDRASLIMRAPDLRSDVLDLARRSSVWGNAATGDGLPAAFSRLYWDGLALAPARHPAYAGASDAVVVPLAAIGSADFVNIGADVEWGGTAGPILSAHSARGSSDFRVRLSADGSNDALTSSKYFDTAVGSASLRATALVSGPVVRDSAEFLFGVDVQRVEQPRPALWPANALAGTLVALAQDSFNIDLSSYTRPGITRTQATSAFGRFDWRASRNHTVSFHGLASQLEADLDALGARSAGHGALLDARDFTAMVAVNSVLGSRMSQELRLAFTRSTRDYADAEVPSTRIADAGLSFGGDPSVAADARRTTVQIVEAFSVSAGRHHLKAGGGVTLSSFDHTFADEAAGAFVFGGVPEMTALRGVFRQSVGLAPVAKFTTPEVALFLQDRWEAAPGLALMFGVRVENELLPRDDVTHNDSLFDLTGLDNAAIPSSFARVAPRLGLRWDPGDRGLWVVRAAAGQYHEALDPALLAELIAGDGGGALVGRRGVGDLGAWPGLPDSTAAAVVGPRFTLLGPSFEAPRSTRLGLSLSRVFGSAVLHLSAAYRHTDFLPRRTDLNRLVAPAGADQYGRPLYGTLVQQGSLLAAQASHRFAGIDRLWAVNADGFSDYWGLSVTLVRESSRGPRLLASYTRSRTTDNWPGGMSGPAAAHLNPFPDNPPGEDWADDRSDFDVPHRVVLGLELALPGPFALSGLYRYESGAPFTPGFRAGVDANGDGADDNDPAFVDNSVSGIAGVLDSWDCLRAQVGEFAARNSCREPGSHRLDLRLTVEPFRIGGAPFYVVVEALNLAESDVGLRDHALYLVDRTGTIATNATTGVVTVPLIANPAFGDVLARRSSGRAWRVGVRIGGW